MEFSGKLACLPGPAGRIETGVERGLAVEQRKVGRVCVLTVTGELKLGPAVDELRGQFKRALERGDRLFVFNMLKVPWMDSSGIGEVVACYKRVREHKGDLRVVMRGRAHDLFTFYELHKVCELHETLEDALGSLAR
jgi:anti-sigma B factor antagonist